MARDDANHEPLLGTVVDERYRIERRLSEGGSGVVYQARHLLLRYPVALRIVRRALTDDDRLVQQLHKDLVKAARIASPHGVVVRDFGRTIDDRLYLVTEFLAGETLAQRLSRVSRLSSATVLALVQQLEDVLGEMHGMKLVHGAVRPDNIFLVGRPGGDFVKLLNIGTGSLAAGYEPLSPHDAPEIRTGASPSARSDIYSLALTTWQALSGGLPFSAPAQGGLPRDTLIPDALLDALQRALHGDPAQRTATVSELARELTPMPTVARPVKIQQAEDPERFLATIQTSPQQVVKMVGARSRVESSEPDGRSESPIGASAPSLAEGAQRPAALGTGRVAVPLEPMDPEHEVEASAALAEFGSSASPWSPHVGTPLDDGEIDDSVARRPAWTYLVALAVVGGLVWGGWWAIKSSKRPPSSQVSVEPPARPLPSPARGISPASRPAAGTPAVRTSAAMGSPDGGSPDGGSPAAMGSPDAALGASKKPVTTTARGRRRRRRRPRRRSRGRARRHIAPAAPAAPEVAPAAERPRPPPPKPEKPTKPAPSPIRMPDWARQR